MTSPLYVNPQALSILQRIPYIGVSEYKGAPTGVDTDSLYVGGSQGEQDDGLARLIARASAFADQFCFGAQGVLAAAANTETFQVRVRRGGFAALVCKTFPILEIDQVLVGPYPNLLSAVDAQTAGYIYVKANRVIYTPTWVSTGTPQASLTTPPQPGDRVHVQCTYIAGYPVATLAADAAPGVSALTLSNVKGMYQGTNLTVKDATGRSEVVQLSATPTSSTVALAAPTVYAHKVPAQPDSILVSGMPETIPMAVILLTSSLIKTRGDEAIVMDSMTGDHPTKSQAEFAGASQDADDAFELLAPFATVR